MFGSPVTELVSWGRSAAVGGVREGRSRPLRILLITPPGGFATKGPIPPLGLLYLAACLRDGGHRVVVRDYAGRGEKRGDFLRDLRSFQPKVVGIALLTEWRFAAAAAARLAKRVVAGVRVVVGGPHASGAPEDTARCPHFDAVVAGPGEAVVGEVVREGRGIVHSPVFPHLDRLPPPARDLLPPRERLFFLSLPGLGRVPAGLLLTSRGCPFGCAFCATGAVHGRRYLTHSVERVLCEVEGLRRLGARALWFCDDVFNADPGRLVRLCEALARVRPTLPFVASVRADLADREQVRLLRAAGCVRLFFGVESASEELLRGVCNRSVSPADALRLARWCDEMGIEKNPGYILGLPGERPSHIQATLKLMRRIGGQPSLSFLRIYPGTGIERLAVERGLLPEGFSWWDRGVFRRLVCRPAFGEVPIYLEGLSWLEVGRLSRLCARPAGLSLGRRGLGGVVHLRAPSDLGHALAAGLGALFA